VLHCFERVGYASCSSCVDAGVSLGGLVLKAVLSGVFTGGALGRLESVEGNTPIAGDGDGAGRILEVSPKIRPVWVFQYAIASAKS
jgi:hypothetical protein